MTSPIPHGGNPAAVRARLGLGDRDLLDVSANLNPLGPPPSVVDAARAAVDRVDHYPEPGCPRLVERIADHHGVATDRVIVGAGTTELIGLVGQSLRAVLALHAEVLGDPRMPLSHLVEPCYGEYRRASVLNDMRTEVWIKHVLGWRQDFLPRSAAGVFWTGHPNNPTGRAWDRTDLLRLVDDCDGLLTVVDEAFLPFLPDEAGRTVVAAAADRVNLLALRSLTKFFAMPGLRVGYAVSSVDMVTRLRQFQDPWSVSPEAEAAAIAALDAPAEYRERTLALIASESRRLLDYLWELPGVRPVWPARERPDDAPPLPNFLLLSLVETPWTSKLLHDEIARRGVLIRECSDFPGLEAGTLLTGPDQLVATLGHIRIAVRTPAENDLVLSTLAAALASPPPG